MNAKKTFIIALLALTVGLSLVIFTPQEAGKSAYEIACEHGFSGTEEEWIASLHYAPVIRGGDTYEIEIVSDPTSVQMAGAKGLMSAVSVWCEFPVYTTVFDFVKGYHNVESTAQAAGSGVIYRIDKNTGDAIVLTNYHVVANTNALTENHIASSIHLFLFGMEYDEYALEAEYVGGSSVYDIAVLRVRDSELLRRSVAQAVSAADSNTVCVGQTALAVGNPEGMGLSVTTGIVSVDSEYITTRGSEDSVRVMRVDAPINEGNSGGGLYDAQGNLIGIVNAKLASTSVDNIGYAIPSNLVVGVADAILFYCENTERETMSRALLGVSFSLNGSSPVYDPTTGRLTVHETVTVHSVNEGSLADGKLQVGDVLLSLTLDGETMEVTRTFQPVDLLLRARENSTVTLRLLRDGAEVQETFTFTASDLVEYH